MNEQELKKEQFIAKAMENKEKGTKALNDAIQIVTLKGFTQAMNGEELWVNTITGEMVKFVVKDRKTRWDLYCKHVKITIEVIDSLSEAIEKANVKITFGIQDWQIKRIEEERERWNNIENGMTENVDMIYSTHFWDKLGKEFAWHPFTLALYYFQYLEECRSL